MATAAAQERAEKMASMYRQGLTLQKIGDHYSITRERVRQILKKHGVVRADNLRSNTTAVRAERRAQILDAQAMAKWGVPHQEKRQHRKSGLLGAFVSQRNCAKARGIAWNLKFGDWLAIWQASGRLDDRGRGLGKFCMSRIKDSGGYVLGNVHIQLCQENSREAMDQWRGKVKAHRGIFALFPGSSRPYVAKFGRRQIGRFASMDEAVAARRDFLLANPGLARSGRGWTRNKGKYQVVVGGKYIGLFSTQEEADAVVAATREAMKAARQGVQNMNPRSDVGFDHASNSLAHH